MEGTDSSASQASFIHVLAAFEPPQLGSTCMKIFNEWWNPRKPHISSSGDVSDKNKKSTSFGRRRGYARNGEEQKALNVAQRDVNTAAAVLVSKKYKVSPNTSPDHTGGLPSACVHTAFNRWRTTSDGCLVSLMEVPPSMRVNSNGWNEALRDEERSLPLISLTIYSLLTETAPTSRFEASSSLIIGSDVEGDFEMEQWMNWLIQLERVSTNCVKGPVDDRLR
ncbi:hypothetical protein Aperf_G00000089870 [Anoplocephala perfoliata]